MGERRSSPRARPEAHPNPPRSQKETDSGVDPSAAVVNPPVRIAGWPRYPGTGRSVDKVAIGVPYNPAKPDPAKPKRGMDIVAMSGGDVVFVEVKNWGLDRWVKPSERDSVLRQLERHNKGAERILRETYRHEKNMVARVLMIEKDGFVAALRSKKQKEFRNEVKKRGWTLELIPSAKIETYPTMLKLLSR